MERNELYETYRQKYGQDEQLLKGCEELGELIVEIMHCHFGRPNLDRMVDEVADCEIMTDQIKYLFDIGH
jgi:hypothetical protein